MIDSIAIVTVKASLALNDLSLLLQLQDVFEIELKP